MRVCAWLWCSLFVPQTACVRACDWKLELVGSSSLWFLQCITRTHPPTHTHRTCTTSLLKTCVDIFTRNSHVHTHTPTHSKRCISLIHLSLIISRLYSVCTYTLRPSSWRGRGGLFPGCWGVGIVGKVRPVFLGSLCLLTLCVHVFIYQHQGSLCCIINHPFSLVLPLYFAKK